MKNLSLFFIAFLLLQLNTIAQDGRVSQTVNSVTDSNTTLIGRWANGPCFAVDVSGNIAYFGNGGYLEVVDISDPSNPIELGKVLIPSAVSGVAVSGSYAYVTDVIDGLRIIDVSTPSNPVEVGFFDTGGRAYGIVVSGDLVYVADGEDGLYIIRNDMAVSVEDHNRLVIPVEFALDQNYPNPFNPSTTIKFALSEPSFVTLKVYDVLGNEVTTLASGESAAGYHEIKFNASSLASGIYFYRLQAGSFVETKKMILMK